MDQNRNERLIILLVSMICMGLTAGSVIMGWEFWVPPLIIIGTVALWVMSIMDRPHFNVRKGLYVVYAMLAVFFYGVHESSFFDAALILSLIMLVYSFLDQVFVMNLFLLEYLIIMGIQIFLASRGGGPAFGAISFSRFLFHLLIVVLTHFCCVRLIVNRAERESMNREKDSRIEAYDADMEDFLSNISHELRTPVNVVNGMSELLIKQNVGYEAHSIKDAGIRLAYQIEDIQDYTECKRQKVILEETEYMSTSLINDVVTGFRMLENNRGLELVVDMDPKVPAKMKGDVKKLHKIFRHLLENAVKFTKQGGIYIRLTSQETAYGVNLCIEVTDTGIGMDRKATSSVTEGMYQANKKRNRSSSGIGLGLYIVYGFAHSMGGFVRIESRKGNGSTIRVTIPQSVADPAPCLALSKAFEGDILFHVRPEKYKVPMVRDFYRSMATNLAAGIRAPLYAAQTVYEVERLREKLHVTHIFMGVEEYEENRGYFEALGKEDIVIAVSAGGDYEPPPGSRIMVLPKPLYAYPVIRILNDRWEAKDLEISDNRTRPVLKGVRALIVDDEPMNLIVARGLFQDYEMIIDTAAGGKEAVLKYRNGAYDVVFMDHMMPEMDGVEAMKLIKKEAREMSREVVVIALTANAVSGAREMFLREGFDGFISKPINMADFDRVMLRVLPGSQAGKGGTEA